MKKSIILVSLFLLFSVIVLFPVRVMAQHATGEMFDPTTVELILAGALGITVVGLTEMLKRWLKTSGVGSYLVSLAVSAAATAYYLVKTTGFTPLSFAGYTVFVFLAANGIYKAVKSTT